METPKHKGKLAGSCGDHTSATTIENPMQRKSPRFKEKKFSGEIYPETYPRPDSKKWGILGECESLEQMTLQQYIDIYKEPLPENSMEAILKLTEVVEEKEKKKSKRKMYKTKKKEATEKAEVNKMPDKKTKRGKKLKIAPGGAMA
jgi:cell division protein YceG involved in septum cleavage